MILIEQISSLILLGSLICIFYLIYKKMPVLAGLNTAALPQSGIRSFFSKIKSRIHFPKISFNFELFLQKTLSMVRVWTLKLESKTSSWLQHLREKAQAKKKFEENDKYWEDIQDKTKK